MQYRPLFLLATTDAGSGVAFVDSVGVAGVFGAAADVVQGFLAEAAGSLPVTSVVGRFRTKPDRMDFWDGRFEIFVTFGLARSAWIF